MATQQTFSFYYVSVDGISFTKIGGGISITDNSDSAGDDISVLGDIPNDTLNFGLEYFGTTTLDELVTLNPLGNSYYLFTDTDHGQDFSPTYSAGGVYELVCYASGSLIRTVVDQIDVVDLNPGDEVISAAGERRTVRWIGSRTLDLTEPRHWTAQPVVIRAEAFGPGLPHSDLRVSPDHGMAMTVNGREVLIPARLLLNGATVVRDDVAEVTYWHVELDGGHDLLLANGVPSESYLDAGNRGFFGGHGNALPNDTTANDMTYCRPIASEVEIAAIRRALEERALALGYVADTAPSLALAGDGVALSIAVEQDEAMARFDAATHALVLTTDVVRPSQRAGDDTRVLGLAIHSLVIADARGVSRIVPLSDARLQAGLLPCDGGGSRWTRRRLVLPSSLWAGMKGSLTLRIGISSPVVRRWSPPPRIAA